MLVLGRFKIISVGLAREGVIRDFVVVGLTINGGVLTQRLVRRQTIFIYTVT